MADDSVGNGDTAHPDAGPKTIVRENVQTSHRGPALEGQATVGRGKDHSLKMEPSVMISLASLSLSALIAIAGLVTWLRGPDITIDAPRMVHFYRDGAEDAGVLKLAISLTAANTAGASYGDALMDATVSPAGGVTGWTVESVARFSVDEQEKSGRSGECPFGARCVSQLGFVAIEDDFEPKVVAGGAVETMNLVFPIVRSHCSGAKADCDTAYFKTEVESFLKEAMELDVTLHFLKEGDKTIRCNFQGLDKAYLLRLGFASRRCTDER